MRISVSFLVIALLVAGCGSPDAVMTTQKERVEKAKAARLRDANSPAVSVCGKIITSDELLKSLIQNNGRQVPLGDILEPLAKANELNTFKFLAEIPLRQALLNRISYILLYEMAQKEFGEKFGEVLEQQVENEVRQYVVRQFGADYDKAQAYLESQGTDWDNFRLTQKRLILVGAQMPEAKLITYGELLETYDQMKDEFYSHPASMQIRLIDIDMARYRPIDPNCDPLEEASKLAADLVRQLKDGADFAEMARQHSHGYRKTYGGLWQPRDPASLAKPYDILATHARKMQPGQITEPIETQPPTHIFIMKLEAKQTEAYTPLRDVQRQIEEKIVLDTRQQAADELDSKIAAQATLVQAAPFINLSLDRIYKTSTQ
jgi:parvulin-like peptidyl-prolyl isomerase